VVPQVPRYDSTFAPMEIFESSLLRINLDLEDKKKAILLLADAIEQETLNCRAEVEKLEALCEAHMRTAGEKKQFELTKGLLKVDVYFGLQDGAPNGRL